MRLLTLAAELLLAASSVSALRPLHGANQHMGAPPLRADDFLAGPGEEDLISKRAAKSSIYWDWFEQLIDHSNPSLGTFKQLYYYDAEFYAGPGSPIVLNAPGENAAVNYTGYVTNQTLPGSFAQKVGGAAILIEHRYWGYSSPFANLTTDNLQYLTLDNAVQDLIYFADNVKLPFDPTGSSAPDKAPWVLSGCSYSGALSAWVHALAPGTFWVHHCSSAVVETIDNFWQYFGVIRDAMPQNCSADFSKVIAHVDKVLSTGTEAAKLKLKTKFGFETLDDQDFGAGLMDGLFTEQSLPFWGQKYGQTDTFHQFCDYIENRWPNGTTPQPGPEGVGLCAAINGMGKWFKEIDIPGGCASYGYSRWTAKNDVGCYVNNDFTSPIYRDTSVGNPVNRQWQWLLCNEPFKYWRTGTAPPDQPRMASSLVDVALWDAQCQLYFPEVNGHKVGVAEGRTNAQVNTLTGGWSNVNTTRLMWANGELDPWKPATVSSPYRPGGPLVSTPEAPVRMIPKATHCSDMLLAAAQANDDLMTIYLEEIENVNQWVGDFYTEHKKPWPLHS